VADSASLLRLLEPAVRPVALPPGRTITPGKLPLEDQSFDALLQQATHLADADPAETSTHAPTDSRPNPNLLAPLSQIQSISNASLRQLVARPDAVAHYPSVQS
jgi:hypothetical protein